MLAVLDSHQVSLLLLQLAIVLATARTLAELARRLELPAVLGELAAGVLLGPTVLGGLAPRLSSAVFPSAGIGFELLEACAWVGMVLLLFLIGAETDVRSLRNLGRPAFCVAIAGTALPFVAGTAVGLLLPESLLPGPDLRLACALFLGVALAIPSVAVLAKILLDTGLNRRDVGIVIFTAAVLGDTVGWLVVSLVAGLCDKEGGSPLPRVGRTLAFLAAFLVAARFLLFPVTKRLTKLVDDRFTTPGSDVALYASFAFAMAALTDGLGIHAVFGAFVAGALVRQVPRLRHAALERIEAVNGAVLAPVFFAFVGLRVDLTRIGSLELLLVVLSVAIASSFAGAYVGARVGGLSPGASRVAGAGLVTKGAMGVIVAVIALSAGAFRPEVYSVVVLMAVGTTVVAPFLLKRFARDLPLTADERLRVEGGASKVLLPLAAPRVLVPTAGGPNAHAALALAAPIARGDGATLVALHVELGGALPRNLTPHFEALRRAASEAGASVEIRSARAESVTAAVLEAARGMDFLFVGASRGSRSIFEPPVETIVQKAPCHVVVVATHEAPVRRPANVLVPTDGSPLARAGLELALAYAKGTGAKVSLLHVVPPRRPDVLASGHGSRSARAVSGRLAVSETDRIRQGLAATLPDARGLDLAVVESSDSTNAILEHAEAGRFDLLVIGAHDRAVEERLFLGYGTETLMERAPCTTAVVIPKV